MKHADRLVFSGGVIPGLEMIGHHARSATLPLLSHTHSGVEVCFIASGEVAWIAGKGQRMHLVGGMISAMPPGIQHHGEMDAIAPSDLYWIVMMPDQIRPALPVALMDRLIRGKPFVASAGAGFQRFFSIMLQECKERTVGWEAAVGGYLSAFAVAVARLAGGAGSGTRKVLPPPVAEAARILTEELENPPSIRELAGRVGLGATRFHDLFRTTIGLTPRDYLGRLRLREACQALSGTSEDITSIAMRLGYPSSQYFATAFRRHTGRSPRTYRAENSN